MSISDNIKYRSQMEGEKEGKEEQREGEQTFRENLAFFLIYVHRKMNHQEKTSIRYSRDHE